MIAAVLPITLIAGGLFLLVDARISAVVFAIGGILLLGGAR